MDWFLIGTLVGTVLGLTGAGGGLVSIPLFIYVAGAGLKEATVFSLMAVFIGSLFNWIPQKKKTAVVSAIGIFLLSLPSSAWMTHVKLTVPDFIIGWLLIIVCLFSLFSFWRGRDLGSQTPHEVNFSPSYAIKIIAIGFLLGSLTTLTGLGGGVLLVPLLLVFLKLGLAQAIATSLLTIFLTSLGSLWFQRHSIPYEISSIQLLALILGVLLSTFFVKFLIKELPTEKLKIIRKILFSLVVTAAVAGVLLRIKT